MAAQDKQVFIKSLAGESRRRRPLWLPSYRALLWFVLAFIVSAGLMHSVQAFRPGFAEQLAHHPFFLIEILSGLLLAPLGAYLALVHTIPGERISRKAVIGFGLLLLAFVVSLAAGFSHFAPESTPVGARHACWKEVIVYGTACLLIFGLLVRRGVVRFSWTLGLLYGLLAGVVPAALMQLACMYDPMHALTFHYLPGLILVPVGLVIMRIIRRK